MSDTFFTSDEHYGHKNIIKFLKRPFNSLDEETEAFINKHNAKVTKGSRVYHLGDLFWRTLIEKQALDIRHALNGQHYFIWGNHDELMEDNQKLQNQFVWCKDIAVLKKTDIMPRIILCHYAMRVWPGSHRGDWHLYGHTHGQLPEHDSLSYDVGVDCNNFEPISIDEISVIMKKKIDLGYGDPLREVIKKQEWGPK